MVLHLSEGKVKDEESLHMLEVDGFGETDGLIVGLGVGGLGQLSQDT